MENFLNCEMKSFDVLQYSPLALAFVGDAVHSLFVRTTLVQKKDIKVNDLQKLTASVVKAISQSKILTAIMGDLTQDELSLVKRARNTKTNNIAKNATAKDYKLSTAFEALIGYLYLSGQIERMNHFLEISYKEILC